jgi:uncharacterized RDD family membrane protein YckC
MDLQPGNWREELSERMENFRKRRARFQPDADSAESLDLDFVGPDKHQDERSLDDALGASADEHSTFDLEIGEPAGDEGTDNPAREILSLEDPGDEMTPLDAAAPEEVSLGEPVATSAPMEIVVGSPTEKTPQEDVTGGIYLATLGRRFLAGLTDALVLMVGAAVFGIIFWRFCGQVSLVPLNIAVLGLAALILVFGYFAVFTGIAAATPGLLWMGCEIRNLRGGYPSVREALWRAFGILVSLSPLMLGFFWAWVDANGLTWHDHMSGTAITMGQTAATMTVAKSSA